MCCRQEYQETPGKYDARYFESLLPVDRDFKSRVSTVRNRDEILSDPVSYFSTEVILEIRKQITNLYKWHEIWPKDPVWSSPR